MAGLRSASPGDRPSSEWRVRGRRRLGAQAFLTALPSGSSTLLVQPLGTGLTPHGRQHFPGDRPVWEPSHFCRDSAGLGTFLGKQTVTWLLGHYFLEIGELPHLLRLHGVSAEELPLGSQVAPSG